MKRYYYKSKDGKGLLNLKSPLKNATGYVKITEAEFNELQPVPVKPTPKELAKQEKLAQISHLKAELSKSDYKALKYAEGWISEEEYVPIKAERQALRDQINELEAQL